MRLLLLVISLTVGLLGMACDEPHRPPLPPSALIPCETGEDDGYFMRAAFLRGADFWTCRRPPAGSSGTAFTDHTGIGVAVTGGSLAFDVAWSGPELQGRKVLLGINNSRGYWRVSAASDSNPMRLELYVDRDATSGDKTLWLAVDDGTGTGDEPSIGPIYEIPLSIIDVGSGDVQVSMSWDTPTDMDLHVTEPSGEEVYFAHKLSSTGGSLDLDSNAGCGIDNVNNENIFWPTGSAPNGDYLVRVHMWSPCESWNQGITTHYRVTIVLGNGDIAMHEGSFPPNSEVWHTVDTVTW